MLIAYRCRDSATRGSAILTVGQIVSAILEAAAAIDFGGVADSREVWREYS
jgi:hypothetical protein